MVIYNTPSLELYILYTNIDQTLVNSITWTVEM